MKQLSKNIKASIGYFIANVVTAGIAYIMTPIYTRLLSTEEYGQTNVFLTWLQVFGIIAMFCLSYGVFNNGMIDYPDKREEYSFSMLVLSNIITLVFAIVFLLSYRYISSWVNIEYPLVFLMFGIFILRPAYLFWAAKERFEYKYKYVVIWSIISAVLSPLVAVICIKLFPSSKLYARLFGAEAVLIVLYLCFYIRAILKSKLKLNTSYWKHAIIFNLPLIPHYLSSYILGSSDKIMISKLIDDSAVAYYSIAYSVSSVVTIVWTAANASLVPYTYEKCKEKDYDSISRVAIPILALFGTACVGIIMLAPEVVYIMATKDYSESIYAIPPIVGGVFFQVHYYLYANVLYYYKKPKFVMIGSLVAAVTNIILNYLLVPRFGYIAAGYTTLLCYFLQAIIDYIAMRIVMKRDIYNIKIITLMSTIMVLISVSSILLYNYYLARYAIILFIVVMLFVMRNKIISFFKKIKG